MKPGPRPKSGCASEYHIRLNETQRRIINNMGYGKPTDKILSLINREGERQNPTSKAELIARWVLSREEAKQKAAYCNAILEKMREIGITEEEIERIDG